VREAANRSKCQNNLKQIALATHMYHDVELKLPPGAVKARVYEPAGTNTLKTYDRYTWNTLILPYLEKDTVFRQWVFDYWGPPGSVGVRSSGTFTLPDTGSRASGALAAQPVRTFICPSDPAIPFSGVVTNVNAKAPAGNNATWSPTNGFQPLTSGDPGFWEWGITSYMGNGGTASYGVLKLYCDPSNFPYDCTNPSQSIERADGQNDARDGTIYLWQYFNGAGSKNASGSNNIDGRYTVTHANITDGASNTFLAGEKSFYDPDYDVACVPSGRQNYLIDQSFWANPSGQDVISGTEFPLNTSFAKLQVLLSGGCGNGQNVTGSDSTSCACDARTTGFSSNHPGGVHFAFCDGSVRFIADSIPLITLQALSTRATGETVTSSY
jgi:prepilin-type processing-associated H-X9-DG protein